MGTFTLESREYRVVDGDVQSRAVGERRWESCTRQSLLSFAVDAPIWDWLRGEGVRRPSPAGYTPEHEANRDTVQVKLRLEPADADRLTALAEAEGTTKSGLVTTWIRKAR